MRIVPFQVGDKWTVALNPRIASSPGIRGASGQSAERTSRAPEGFWSDKEKRWEPGHGLAASFGSEEEAQAYIDEHYDKLQSTPRRYPA